MSQTQQTTNLNPGQGSTIVPSGVITTTNPPVQGSTIVPSGVITGPTTAGPTTGTLEEIKNETPTTDVKEVPSWLKKNAIWLFPVIFICMILILFIIIPLSIYLIGVFIALILAYYSEKDYESFVFFRPWHHAFKYHWIYVWRFFKG